MKPALLLGVAAACALLAGCLEVPQHPLWRDGAYRGKHDELPQQTFYHGDRMDWMATIDNRSRQQDEYPRTEGEEAQHHE
jgi:hypothetical protein